MPCSAGASEVKDAHDRYANLEVSYVLQRLEAHPGLAIVVTRSGSALDAAFQRRMTEIVEFPRPDAESREAIWRRGTCQPAPVSRRSTTNVWRA